LGHGAAPGLKFRTKVLRTFVRQSYEYLL
jgi:hypothetical protein